MTTTLIVLFWISASLVIYVQLGYPLLLSVLALFRRRKSVEPHVDPPRVTVIIPVYNEEKVLAQKIENTLALNYPPGRLEVLVASDGSTDRSVEFCRPFFEQGVRVLDFPDRRGKSAVVDDAIREAQGEVLCLCDANVLMAADALPRLVAHLQDPKVGAVTGDVQLASDDSEFGEGEKAYYRLERLVQEKESLIGSTMGVDGGMYVVRRDLIDSISNTILDDFVIAMQVIRKGKRVIYEPAAVAHESATIKPSHEFRRRIRVAAGAVQALRRGQFPGLRQPLALWHFLSHKLLRWLGPVWLLMLLVSSAVLFSSGLVFQIAVAAQACVYLAAIVAAVIPAFRRTRPGGIAFYFVLSHLAMAVGLFKGLVNRQSPVWPRTERSRVPREQASNPNAIA